MASNIKDIENAMKKTSTISVRLDEHEFYYLNILRLHYLRTQNIKFRYTDLIRNLINEKGILLETEETQMKFKKTDKLMQLVQQKAIKKNDASKNLIFPKKQTIKNKKTVLKLNMNKPIGSLLENSTESLASKLKNLKEKM